MTKSHKHALQTSKMVGYLRTSTVDQLLGIDGQREKVQWIAKTRSCTVVRWFTEHESGGDNERVELDKAMRYARRTQAIVCVAKLDRLARDQSFVMKLYDGKVPIIFGDMPDLAFTAADRVMVQMIGVFAEFELNRMRERMREWHRQRKAQGLSSGVPKNMSQEGRSKGAKIAATLRTAEAVEEMADIAEIASEKVNEGWSTGRIAAYLNSEGYPTRRGAKWHPNQVARVLKRLEKGV